MVGDVITLPLRIGVRATRLWMRAAEEATAVAASATGQLIDVVVSRDSTARRTAPPQDGLAEGPVTAPPAEASPEERERPPSMETHVSEEPELVQELAEPGAEEGAGPELRVREPWDGYGRMSSEDVIARLARATSAELAAVQLYESERQGRQTVLAAVESELRSSSEGSQS